MKRLVIGLLLVVLTACGTEVGVSSENSYSDHLKHVTTTEGLECVIYDYSTFGGGISCNWEAYNRRDED